MLRDVHQPSLPLLDALHMVGEGLTFRAAGRLWPQGTAGVSTVPHEYDGEMMIGCCRQHSSPSSPLSSSSSSSGNRPLSSVGSSTLKSAQATTSPSSRAAYCTQRAGLLPLTPPSPDSHTAVQSGLPQQIWTRLNPLFYAHALTSQSPRPQQHHH